MVDGAYVGSLGAGFSELVLQLLQRFLVHLHNVLHGVKADLEASGEGVACGRTTGEGCSRRRPRGVATAS